jgi:hypothetical protein
VEWERGIDSAARLWYSSGLANHGTGNSSSKTGGANNMAKAAKKTKAERQAELGKKMGKRHEEVVELPPTQEAVEYFQKMARENMYEAMDDQPEEIQPEDVEQLNEELAEQEEDVKEPSSVVKDVFKNRYIANARENGIKGKAAKRSNWDWLAQQIAMVCLNDNHSIRMDDFVALLDANGVDHSRWVNRNRGWEGRFRMTGRVALQRIVADKGELKYPNGDVAMAPMEFILKYKAK